MKDSRISPFTFRPGDESERKKIMEKIKKSGLSMREYMLKAVDDYDKEPIEQKDDEEQPSEMENELQVQTSPSIGGETQPESQIEPASDFQQHPVPTRQDMQPQQSINQPQQQQPIQNPILQNPQPIYQQQPVYQQQPTFPPHVPVKPDYQQNEVEFLESFLQSFNINHITRRLLCAETARTGVLPDAFTLQNELTVLKTDSIGKGSIPALGRIYHEEKERFLQHRRLEHERQHPSGYGGYPSNQNVKYDLGSSSLRNENLELKAEIKRRDKLVEEQFRTSMLDAQNKTNQKIGQMENNLPQVVSQILQGLESRVDKDYVEKKFRELAGQQGQNIALTGTDYVSLRRMENELTQQREERVDKKETVKGYVDTIAEVLPLGLEALGRGMAAPQEQHPHPTKTTQQTSQLGHPGMPNAPLKPIAENIQCLFCGTSLMLPKNASVGSQFTCGRCHSLMAINNEGYLILEKQGNVPPEEKLSNAPSTSNAPGPTPEEEQTFLGNCTRCGSPVSETGLHMVGRTDKGEVTCISCVQAEEREKAEREPRGATGREHDTTKKEEPQGQMTDQLGICETCGAPVQENNLGIRHQDGKVFCRDCMKTKKELEDENRRG